MAIDFFISHSHKDKEIAKYLVSFLVAAVGVQRREILCTSNVTTGLKTGVVIHEQLRKDIKRSSYFMPLITKNTSDSNFVMFEIGAAWALEKDIIPLIFGSFAGIEIPSLLSGVMFRDISLQENLVTLAEELATEIFYAKDRPTSAEMLMAAKEFLESLADSEISSLTTSE